jgi:hypothetical protein
MRVDVCLMIKQEIFSVKRGELVDKPRMDLVKDSEGYYNSRSYALMCSWRLIRYQNQRDMSAFVESRLLVSMNVEADKR